MVLEKGSFGQMPIVQPQKMGSLGQDTQNLGKNCPDFLFLLSFVEKFLVQSWEYT